MRKAFVTLVAVATIAGSVLALSSVAEAGKSGRALTYGILGGVAAGALIAGAAGAGPVYAPPPPAYYAPPPPPVYYEQPACRLVKERYWDGYGWRTRRYEVC